MGTKRELYRLLQLIMKIHIKNDMETVCTTQKTQGDPLYDGAENTCLIGFWMINQPPFPPKCPEKDSLQFWNYLSKGYTVS